MSDPSPRAPVSSHVAPSIATLKTPLQLIGIPVIVVEIVLLILAAKAEGADRTILIVGMLIILLMVVTVGWRLARQPDKPLPALPTSSVHDSRQIRLEGDYYAGERDGERDRINKNYRVTFKHITGEIYSLTNPEWFGVGVFDGRRYHGVFVYGSDSYTPDMNNSWGTHLAIFDPAECSFALKYRNLNGRTLNWDEGVWVAAGKYGHPHD